MENSTGNSGTNGEKHVRRPHYSGSYPKTFREKYKELQPDRYAGTLQKVLEKGGTPAGTHVPIMVEEILSVLRIGPGMKGLDATLGYGGHSERMLNCLAGAGHLYAIDTDPIEIVKTESRLRKCGFGEDLLTVRHLNFSEIGRLAEETGPFDFILADLGVSSMQIDNPERGFSWKTDGPLDLRMDPEKGIPAAERLKEMDEAEIYGMLTENADEPYAAEIAQTVFSDLKRRIPLETTAELRAAVARALKRVPAADREEAVKKSCARTFQALRIDINSEYEVLFSFLENLPSVLAPGGRAAILTFHSGEDRLVKKAFQEGLRNGLYADIAKEVMRPTPEECFRNSRAHSAKLRWAVKK